MARIGGRSTVARRARGTAVRRVVAALVWLALPMVPVAIAWVGDTLRTATFATPAADGRADARGARGSRQRIDCRALYPDALWAELSWHGGALLVADRRTARHGGDVRSRRPWRRRPRVTCSWRLETGGGDRDDASPPSPTAPPSSPTRRCAAQGFSCDGERRRAALPTRERRRHRGAHRPRRALALERRDGVASRGVRRPRRSAGLGRRRRIVQASGATGSAKTFSTIAGGVAARREVRVDRVDQDVVAPVQRPPVGDRDTARSARSSRSGCPSSGV